MGTRVLRYSLSLPECVLLVALTVRLLARLETSYRIGKVRSIHRTFLYPFRERSKRGPKRSFFNHPPPSPHYLDIDCGFSTKFSFVLFSFSFALFLSQTPPNKNPFLQKAQKNLKNSENSQICDISKSPRLISSDIKFQSHTINFFCATSLTKRP